MASSKDRKIDTQMQVNLTETVTEACWHDSGYTGNIETKSMNCPGTEIAKLELGFMG